MVTLGRADWQMLFVTVYLGQVQVICVSNLTCKKILVVNESLSLIHVIL